MKKFFPNMPKTVYTYKTPNSSNSRSMFTSDFLEIAKRTKIFFGHGNQTELETFRLI